MGLFDRRNKPVEVPVETRNNDTFLSAVKNGIYSNDGMVQGISAVFAAIELISNSIGMLPIVIKKDGQADYDHHLNLVFRNMFISKFMFIKQLIVDMFIRGKGYAYIKRSADGKPVDLVYLEGGSTTEFYNNQSRELYYMNSTVSKNKIEPKDMLVFYKNTQNGVNGKSIIWYAKKIFDICKYSDKAASDFYSSGCNVNGLLTIAGNPSQQEVEKIREQWRVLHSSDGGSGLAILKGNMTYQSLGSSAADSQLLDVRQFNVTEVARFFNISPVLLGDLSKSSYNTLEAANLEFITHTLLPIITMIEEELTRKLLGADEMNIHIDLDENYLLRSDKNSMANYLNKLVASGIMTVNEARKQLGLVAVEGANSLIIPFTKIADNTIGNTEKTKQENE